MALNLPPELVIEKNKLSSTHPWIILLELYLQDDLVVRLTRNTENITFRGNEYIAIPFELDLISETSKGEIPRVELRISNVTRVLQPYMEYYYGAVGQPVKIITVHTDNLDSDYSDLELEFEIVGTEATAEWLTVHLGIPNPMNKRFPKEKYVANHCNWRFRSPQCGYTGEAQFCDRTYETCKRLRNTRRFGGFRGLKGGIRITI